MDRSTDLPDGKVRRRPSGRRTAAIGLVVVLVATGAVLAVTDPFSSSPASNGGVTDNAYPTSVQTVTRQTLTSQTQVNATLGYSGTYDVAIPGGTTAATLTSDEDAVQADTAKVASDRTALAKARAVAGPTAGSTLLADEAAVRSDEQTLREAEQLLTSDRRLGCPASSSATVGTASSSGSPATSSGSPSTTSTTTPSSSGSPSGTSGAHAHALRLAPLSASGSGTSGSAPTTTTTVPATAPDATTGTVDSTTATSTTVTGTVSPNGADTHYELEYGTSANYGSTTASTDAGSGTSPVAVTVSLGGLAPSTTYHYRLVATSSLGTAYGQDATFTTSGPPVATTGSASTASARSEVLSGTVQPSSADTTYYFAWGPTGSLAHTTPVTSAGGGSSPTSVAATVTGLRPGATYAFRLVAKNAYGESEGLTVTFQTAASSCVAQTTVVNEDARAVRTARNSLTIDRSGTGSAVASDESALSSDEATLAAASAALGVDRARAANPGSTFTELPAVGATVTRGKPVYALDGAPVPLLYGETTPYRALYEGVTAGPDVAELNANLAALGYGAPAGSDTFSAATASAVRAWQAALGVPTTGVVALGDVVVEPGPIEVTTVPVSDGAAASAGTAVLTATSTSPIVTIALDASQQSEVKVGDPVTITLPDNSTTPGVVSYVGKIATSPPSSGNGNSGGSSSATITVEVTPSNAKATRGLDQAPVEVSITTAQVSNVLVVPVDSLLALAGGGYAVEEVGTAGHHELVGVSLGLFDDAAGLVQVSGNGLAAGQRIVVPNV